MAPSSSPWYLDYSSVASSKSLSSVPTPPGLDQKLLKHSEKAAAVATAAEVARSSQELQVNPMEDPLAALGFKASSPRMKRAWDLAISPAKSLPMQAFMLYMSGSGVQIFSMGTVWMLLSNPIKGVTQLSKVFQPFEAVPSRTQSGPIDDASLLIPKIVFLLCQCLTLALGLWKCNQMGILPTGSADFLAFETRGPAPEQSFVVGLPGRH